MDEATLSRKIRLALQKEFPGSYWAKIAGGPHQRKGLPDIVGCVHGQFIGIEVKLPSRRHEKGAVTEIQQDTLNMIYNAGGCSFVAYDVQEIIRDIKTCLKAVGKL
jgi:hypothetical protein